MNEYDPEVEKDIIEKEFYKIIENSPLNETQIIDVLLAIARQLLDNIKQSIRKRVL